MKKLLIVFFSVIIISVISMMVVYGNSKFNIVIGNEYVVSDLSASLQNNRIYVSLRSICEELEIPIYWDDKKMRL